MLSRQSGLLIKAHKPSQARGARLPQDKQWLIRHSPVASIQCPTTSPRLLFPRAEVDVAPGTSSVVKATIASSGSQGPKTSASTTRTANDQFMSALLTGAVVQQLRLRVIDRRRRLKSAVQNMLSCTSARASSRCYVCCSSCLNATQCQTSGAQRVGRFDCPTSAELYWGLRVY